MKIVTKLACIALAATCLALASCGKDAEKEQGTTNKAPVENVQQNEQQTQQDTQSGETADNGKDKEFVDDLSNQAVEIMGKLPEYPEGYPTLEDVSNVYKKANMAVGWIVSTEPVPVYDNVTITVDGIKYCRVRPDCFYGAANLQKYADKADEFQKLIFDFDSLEAYLCTLMSPQEAELYIEDAKDLKKFTEDENGYLYALPFSYTPEGFGKEVYTLDDNGDGTYTFNVKYELVDEDGKVYKEKTKEFNFIQVDGRWVFEDFVVIRQN